MIEGVFVPREEYEALIALVRKIRTESADLAILAAEAGAVAMADPEKVLMGDVVDRFSALPGVKRVRVEKEFTVVIRGPRELRLKIYEVEKVLIAAYPTASFDFVTEYTDLEG